MANSASLRQISSGRQSCAASSIDTCSSMVSKKKKDYDHWSGFESKVLQKVVVRIIGQCLIHRVH